MSRIRRTLKNAIPRSVRDLRHFWFAFWGAVKYNHPSKELIVIGVTGTSGKSSVCFFLRQALEACGYTVGSLSTLEFYVAGEQKLNDRKMTMLGKMEIQRYLRKMVQSGCDVAIIETTSEGFLQYRHRFISYDMMILTNLYPEHLRAHGGFENYKKAKLDIFEYVATLSNVKKDKAIPRTAIINADCDYADEFRTIEFDKALTYGTANESDIMARDMVAHADGVSFSIHNHTFNPHIFGIHNIENILAVISACRSLDLPWAQIEDAINSIVPAPGRIEHIKESQKRGFHVIVDYAFEPVALQKLYDVVDMLSPKKIIHVTGNTGGGRDKPDKKAAVIAQNADIVIVTNEDPYDDDPQTIIDEMHDCLIQSGAAEDAIERISNRKRAIEHALSLAKKGDIVLITGKGSEQKMCVANGVMIDWDDRVVVRSLL